MNKICWKGRAFKALSFGQNSKKAGRNFSGSITIFHRGGGSKKLLRRIDFQRKNLAKGCIERIEYDPNRTARIALVRWSNIKLNDSMSNVQSTDPGHQIEGVRASEVTIGVPRLELSSTCRRLNWRPRLLFAHGTSFLRRSFLPYWQLEQNVMYRAAGTKLPQRFVPERTTKLAEQKVLLFADSVTNAHSHERCVSSTTYTRSASADSAQRFVQSDKVRQFSHSVQSTGAGTGVVIRPLQTEVPKVPIVQGTSVRSAFSYILASDGLRCGDEILNITALSSVGSLDQVPKDSHSLMSKTGSIDENLLQPIGTILKYEPKGTNVLSSHKSVGCLHPAGSQPKRATQQTEPKVPQVVFSGSAQRMSGVSVEPDTIRPSDHAADVYQKSGTSLPLWLVPIGSVLHNIELYPSGGGKIARAAGTSAQLVSRLVAPVAVSSLQESLAGGPPHTRSRGYVVNYPQRGDALAHLQGPSGQYWQSLQHASYVSEQREVLQFFQNRAFESPMLDPTFQGCLQPQDDLLKRGASALRSSVSSRPTAVHPYMRGSSLCTIRLPSGQQQLLDLRCRATIGCVSNIEHRARMLTKAGQSRWLGFRPVVRGVAMNPIDHPHGGGAGRTKGGRPSVSPWGKPAKRARRYR